MTPKTFHKNVIDWYARHGRKNLPWQQEKTHYTVWLSEIMLQQTQVTTVIGYYNRFLSHFPTVSDLANAHLDDVLSLWAGLGYYARARNLHKTAVIINTRYDGIFPSNLDDLIELPGIGKSTACAILSLTENRPFAILDGNVKRVLSRYFCEGDKNTLWKLAENCVQPTQAANYTQAMMDIGSLICTRSKPKCLLCPLESHCEAKKTQTTHLYPPKQKVKQKRDQHLDILIIAKERKVLLQRRSEKGIWGGLFSMPLVERAYTESLNQVKIFPQKTHIFTHFKLHYRPVLILTDQHKVDHEGEFFEINNALKLGIPKPINAILTEFKELIDEHDSLHKTQ